VHPDEEEKIDRREKKEKKLETKITEEKELKKYYDDRKAESEEIDQIEDLAIERWQKGTEISKGVLSASEESSSSEQRKAIRPRIKKLIPKTKPGAHGEKDSNFQFIDPLQGILTSSGDEMQIIRKETTKELPELHEMLSSSEGESIFRKPASDERVSGEDKHSEEKSVLDPVIESKEEAKPESPREEKK